MIGGGVQKDVGRHFESAKCPCTIQMPKAIDVRHSRGTMLVNPIKTLQFRKKILCSVCVYYSHSKSHIHVVLQITTI